MPPTVDRPRKKAKKDSAAAPVTATAAVGDVADLNTKDAPADAEEPTKKRKRDNKEVEELEVDVTLPEPLSKKEARKAKKAKPSNPDAATTEAPSTTTTEETTRSAHGIWIGNLSWTTTKAHLHDFLVANSSGGITAEQITRVHMPVPFKAAATKTQLKPQNKGFAYVDFASEAALFAALQLSEAQLGGRNVLIKNAKSFEGRPEKREGVDGAVSDKPPGSQKPPSKRVFVGNLSFDVTKEELSEHFNTAGKVVDLHMATFEDSGKCKGFAWVTFEELDAAEAAVRGWTKVPVVKGGDADDNDDDDSAADDDDDNDDDDDDSDGAPQPRKPKPSKSKTSSAAKPPKTRKWFINKLHGRPLRCEFAEDAQSRYKKRFGKDDASTATAAADEKPENKPKRAFKKKPDAAGADIKPGAPTDGAKRRGRTAAGPPPTKEQAYKTGAITEGKGKKVVF